MAGNTQTARVWEADLGEQGRKLSLEELRTLELMHACANLTRVVVALEAMGRHLASLEGRFDRLEQFLARLDPHRYPQTAALPDGHAP
jgi:hypothetical protein